MLFLIPILLLAGAPSAPAQTASETYWLYMNNDGQTWCGYRDSTEFKAQVEKMSPAPQQSGKVTYLAGKLAEVTEQFTPESGDWIVIDEYTPKNGALVVRRSNLLAQAQLRVVQTAVIEKGKVEPFRIESITTSAGEQAELPPHLDFPDVPIAADVSKLPLMSVVDEMRNRRIGRLCKKEG